MNPKRHRKTGRMRRTAAKQSDRSSDRHLFLAFEGAICLHCGKPVDHDIHKISDEKLASGA